MIKDNGHTCTADMVKGDGLGDMWNTIPCLIDRQEWPKLFEIARRVNKMREEYVIYGKASVTK